MSRQKGKRSLFVVILASSLVCITLITLLILRISAGATYDFEKQFVDIEQTETDAVGSILDQDITRTLNRMYDIVVNNYVQQAALYLSEGKYSLRLQTAVRNIQAELSSLESSNGFSWDAAIYLPQSGRMITAEEMIPYEEGTDLTLAGYLEKDTVFISEDTLTLRASLPFTYQSSYEKGTAILICQLKLAGLNDYLKSFSQQDDGAQFAVYALGETDQPLKAAAWAPLSDQAWQTAAKLLSGAVSDSGLHRLDGEEYLITWRRSEKIPDFFLWQMTQAVGMSDQISSFVSGIVLGYLGIAVIMLALMLTTFLLISRPIARVSRALMRFNQGKLDTRIGSAQYVEFQDMFSQFDNMAQRIQTLIETEYELRVLHFQAELKQIQYQINPHFLYNSYFILRAMLYEKKNKQAIQLAELLGNYLRYITVSDNEYAVLSEEIEHTMAYAQIQQYRFKDRMEIRFSDCPREHLSISVPRLILQPLVENAFVHGVKQNEGPGIISVRFEAEGEDLLIIVEDNGESADDQMIAELQAQLDKSDQLLSISGGVALLNIHKRLKMIYKQNSGLRLSRSQLGGISVTMRISGRDGYVSADDRRRRGNDTGFPVQLP